MDEDINTTYYDRSAEDFLINRPALMFALAVTFVIPVGVVGPRIEAIGVSGLFIGLVGPILVLIVWLTFIELPKSAKQDSEYPKSYTRTRQYHGYHIEVAVEEWRRDDRLRNLQRTVEATAVDDMGAIIASERLTAHAGRLPRTRFDAAIGDNRNGSPVGTQTRRVLDRLYDDILAHEATGSVDSTEGVDSAFDVVFGEPHGER